MSHSQGQRADPFDEPFAAQDRLLELTDQGVALRTLGDHAGDDGGREEDLSHSRLSHASHNTYFIMCFTVLLIFYSYRCFDVYSIS